MPGPYQGPPGLVRLHRFCHCHAVRSLSAARLLTPVHSFVIYRLDLATSQVRPGSFATLSDHLPSSLVRLPAAFAVSNPLAGVFLIHARKVMATVAKEGSRGPAAGARVRLWLCMFVPSRCLSVGAWLLGCSGGRRGPAARASPVLMCLTLSVLSCTC